MKRPASPRPALLLALALGGCGQDYQVAEGSGAVVVSPGLVDAGAVAVGSDQAVLVNVTHASGGRVKVLAVEVQGADAGAFSVDGDPYLDLGVGERGEILFRFAPSEADYFLAQATIVTNAQKNAEQVVTLRGQGVWATAELLPSIVDFGAVPTGSTATSTIALLNSSSSTLNLDALTFADPRFSSSLELPAEVAAGASLPIPLAFAADSADEAAATLEVTVSPAATLPLVQLRANACATGGGALYDRDGDGYSGCDIDCDDGSASSYPGAPESCDGVDQDCDGLVDEGTDCVDDDGDGFSEDEGDCNDGDAARSPSNAEQPDNGVDDDCDGVVDGGAADGDNDGYDTLGGDCDDADPTVFPGAPELVDGVDNDCDGAIDEGTRAVDDDGDGVTEDAGDCDDTDPSRGPAAAEVANGVDDDCDGSVDEGTAWADDDGDGATERAGDCDDADARAYPGAVEIAGDGIDNDCDGTVE